MSSCWLSNFLLTLSFGRNFSVLPAAVPSVTLWPYSVRMLELWDSICVVLSSCTAGTSNLFYLWKQLLAGSQKQGCREKIIPTAHGESHAYAVHRRHSLVASIAIRGYCTEKKSPCALSLHDLCHRHCHCVSVNAWRRSYGWWWW